MDDEKKIAFVTNGTDKDCARLCVELAKKGYSVGFTYGSEERLASELAGAIESSGGEALACRAEKFSAEELSFAVIGTAEKFGGVDLFVFFRHRAASAGTDGGMLLDLDEEDWDASMNWGAKAFFLSCKYVLPYLISRAGASVAVIDLCGLPASGGLTDHVSGAALRSVFERASLELSYYGISAVYKNASDDGWMPEIIEEA